MAKLNNRQLKKLYDYGGTLSPKDWADMIDTLVPEDIDLFEKFKHYPIESFENKTIEELKSNTLYHYPIDLKYNNDNGFYSENLMIYLNPEDPTKLKCISDHNIYDTGSYDSLNDFIADFRLDGMVKISWLQDGMDEYSICDIKSTHSVEFDALSYATNFINILKRYNISYEIITNDDQTASIIIKDVLYVNITGEWTYSVISNGNIIIYTDTDSNQWEVLEKPADIDSGIYDISCHNEPLIYNITLKNGLHQDYFVMNATFMDGYIEDTTDVSNLEIIDTPVPSILTVDVNYSGISGLIKHTDLNELGTVSCNIIAINGAIFLSDY